jgi:hypothetical protein
MLVSSILRLEVKAVRIHDTLNRAAQMLCEADCEVGMTLALIGAPHSAGAARPLKDARQAAAA